MGKLTCEYRFAAGQVAALKKDAKMPPLGATQLPVMHCRLVAGVMPELAAHAENAVLGVLVPGTGGNSANARVAGLAAVAHLGSV